MERPPPIQVLPDPAPLKFAPVEFVTVGDDKPLPPGPFVCVAPRGYETLSRNLGEAARWVDEARWRLDHYRQALTPKREPPPAEDGKQGVNLLETPAR